MTSEGIQRPLVFGFVALGLIPAGRLLHKIGNLSHEFGFSGLHAPMAHGLVSLCRLALALIFVPSTATVPTQAPRLMQKLLELSSNLGLFGWRKQCDRSDIDFHLINCMLFNVAYWFSLAFWLLFFTSVLLWAIG